MSRALDPKGAKVSLLGSGGIACWHPGDEGILRALTLTAAAALGFSLALAPSYARAADKDWGACVNKDGNESYFGCEAFLKRGDTESVRNRAHRLFLPGPPRIDSGRLPPGN
jgi:hypothetical protein